MRDRAHPNVDRRPCVAKAALMLNESGFRIGGRLRSWTCAAGVADRLREEHALLFAQG